MAGSRGAGALALPLDEEPRHWDAAEVTWDPAARTLSRTERPGYGEVVFTQVTRTLTTLTPTLTPTLILTLILTLTLP